MFEENNKTEMADVETAEAFSADGYSAEISDDGETTVSDQSSGEVPEKIYGGDGVFSEQYEESGKTSAPKEDYISVEDATARATAQIERLKESVGLAGPWGKLFGKYPSLSRESAYAELSDAVKSGMTPLEAYQSKLLEEKETALRIATQNGEAAKRSVGSLEGDGDGEELSDFLIGFNSIYD